MRRVGKLVRVGAGITAAILLGGCAAGFSSYPHGANVDPASTVKVNQSFGIPYESARVYFQGGKNVTWGQLDRYVTYCSVSVQNIKYPGEPQNTVNPGTFDIVNVKQRNDNTGRIRVFVASSSDPFDFPSNVKYEVEMRLTSSEQPDVRSLFCAKRQDRLPRGLNLFPKLEEMQVALGDIIDIIPPQ